MKIIVESEYNLLYLPKEISHLTNGSIIKIENIKYMKEKKQVCMILKRKNHNKKDSWVNSEIIIKKVIDFKLKENRIIQEFIVLFGIRVELNEIYLASVEESKGVHLVEVLIKTESIDITLKDI